MMSDNPYIITHNHPNGSSFSDADLATSVEAHIHEMRCFGKKYEYSISGFDNPNLKIDAKEIKDTWNGLQKKIMVRDISKILSMTPSQSEAYFYQWTDEVMRELTKKYRGLKYKRILRSGFRYSKSGRC